MKRKLRLALVPITTAVILLSTASPAGAQIDSTPWRSAWYVGFGGWADIGIGWLWWRQ